MSKHTNNLASNKYIKVGYASHMGRGIFAKTNIPINTEILEAQKEKYITYKVLQKHPFMSKICGET